MDRDQAREVLRVLAHGVDPGTDEILPDSSPYQSVQAVRALHAAIDALRSQRSWSLCPGNDLPSCAGVPWTPDEDAQVTADLHNRLPIHAMAEAHGRTTGPIRSRLERLVLILDDRPASGESQSRAP